MGYGRIGLIDKVFRSRLLLIAVGLAIVLGSIAYYPRLIQWWPWAYIDIVRWTEPFIEIFGGALVALAIVSGRQRNRLRWAKTIAAILVISAIATYTYYQLRESGQIDQWLERITKSGTAPGLVKEQIPTLTTTLRSVDSYLQVDDSLIAAVPVSTITPSASVGSRASSSASRQAESSLPTSTSESPNKPHRVYIGRSYIVGANGQPILLTNNPDAKNPSWDQLKQFLKVDPTDKREYQYGSFVCADFGEMLHNNAEKAGWQAAYVLLQLGPSSTRSIIAGHVVNAFQTTDRGLVFIDSTGSLSGVGPHDGETTSPLEVGEHYIPKSIFPEPGWSSTWGDMGEVLEIEKIHW